MINITAANVYIEKICNVNITKLTNVNIEIFQGIINENRSSLNGKKI